MELNHKKHNEVMNAWPFNNKLIMIVLFFFCTLQNRFPWNTEALQKQMSFIKQKSKL